MNISEKENTVKTLMETLSSLNTLDSVEILANCMLQLGLENIDSPAQLDQVAAVFADREKGETLYNALALQGLMLLTWIETVKTNDKQRSKTK